MSPYRSLTIKMVNENSDNKIYLLTPQQVIGMLQISRATLYRLMGMRKFPFCKIGGAIRFRVADIEEYIEKSFINYL